jgi:hypothetical protein
MLALIELSPVQKTPILLIRPAESFASSATETSPAEFAEVRTLPGFKILQNQGPK